MNNSVEVTRGDKTYVFVTRGRSKVFSSDEVAEYFNDDTPVKPLDIWHIPDTKQRKIMFMRDIQQMGLKHCANKYAVSNEDIIREAKRLAPHIKLANDG